MKKHENMKIELKQKKTKENYNKISKKIQSTTLGILHNLPKHVRYFLFRHNEIIICDYNS